MNFLFLINPPCSAASGWLSNVFRKFGRR